MAEARKFFHPKDRRTREFQLARMMMVLVVVFLLLNCPRLALGLIEVTQLSEVAHCFQQGLDYHLYKETYLLDFTARFLVIINSSINVIIYCLAGSQFRNKLITILNINLKASSLLLASNNGNNIGNEQTEPAKTSLSSKSRY